MKTRIVVHIALNAENERVCCLVSVAGRFIPFNGWSFTERLRAWEQRAVTEWMDSDYGVEESLEEWKDFSKRYNGAIRFQRVTLQGETK